MKVKTSDLAGAELDWAVGVALGFNPQYSNNVGGLSIAEPYSKGDKFIWQPSTCWAQCGPLLANLMTSGQWGITPFTDGQIMISNTNSDCLPYNGDWEQASINVFGDDILIATCRAIVIRKIGEEVDMPNPLL